MQNNLQIECNPYQNSMAFSTEIEKNILKIIWHFKTPWIDKTISKIPDSKTYYKAAIITTMWTGKRTDL
jgi:hypothetical protein